MFVARVQAFGDTFIGDLPSFQIFINDGPNPLTWDALLLTFWCSSNPTVFQDKLVNLMNNLQGGHCCVSSRTRRNTCEKIAKFKPGHPHFDGGIGWCMFSSCFCQNAINFLPLLALQEKQIWWHLANPCFWNLARRLKYYFSLCKRKRLTIRHMNRSIRPTKLSVLSYEWRN